MQELSTHIFGYKEISKYTRGVRHLDMEIGIWLSVDPLAEEYPMHSPYVYCGNNPVMLVDPDGMEICFWNITKTDQNGNGVKEPGISSTSKAALIDLMKTSEAREFFGQFAKEGDVIGGYKFTRDGDLSDKTLVVWDYSYEKGDRPEYAIPNTGGIQFNAVKGEVVLKIVTNGSTKFEAAETFLHEILVHGFKAKDKLNGKKGTSEFEDHIALKNNNIKHIGYNKYKSAQLKLEKINNMYVEIFQNAKEQYENNY